MGQIFNPPRRKDPSPPPPPPAAGDSEVEAARRAEIERAAKVSRRGTLLTGGPGVTEETTTQRATLLGG